AVLRHVDAGVPGGGAGVPAVVRGGDGAAGIRGGRAVRAAAMIGRRRWLGGVAAGLAAGVCGVRRARAAWGTWPKEQADLALPPERTAGRVLELYAYGGLCAWDTFYCVPRWGKDAQRYLYAFGEAALQARLSACGVPQELARPLAEDAAGELVHL